ncbi:MAG: chorismate mutase [Alkalispirochaeta sp.]
MDELTALREEIDRLDAALVYILGQRFACTERIGCIKQQRDLPAYDGEREAAQKERLNSLAEDAGLSPSVVTAVFETIMATVKERHDEIRRLG